MKTYFKKSPLKWGIIGCGDVTEIKSGPAYNLTDGFKLKGVMRRDVVKAEDYAKRHNVPFFTDNAEEIINNPVIDAVYIATPPDSHKYYGLLVAKAGKPCCIEKPMAPSYKESLAIYEAFKERELPLFIAYYRRSLPRFLKIKDWLDKGYIGEVRHVNWLKNRTASPLDLSNEYNWRTDAKIASAGYFDDVGSHGLDLFAFLLGNIENASGFASNQQGLYSAFDCVTGSWTHKNGISGSGSWVFGAFEPKDEVTIFGSKGEIRFSVLMDAPIALISSIKNESLVIEHPKHLHQHHVANMKKHLFGLSVHPSSGESGLHTSWVMDKILNSN